MGVWKEQVYIIWKGNYNLENYGSTMGMMYVLKTRNHRWMRSEEVHTSFRKVELSSPCECSIFLEKTKFVQWLLLANLCSAFRLEPVHDLHFGTSKLLKNCFTSFAWSATICREKPGLFDDVQLLWLLKGNVLEACMTLLAKIEKGVPVSCLPLSFWRGEISFSDFWTAQECMCALFDGGIW